MTLTEFERTLKSELEKELGKVECWELRKSMQILERGNSRAKSKDGYLEALQIIINQIRKCMRR